MKDKDTKFWIIIDRNLPTRVTCRHDNYWSADNEAKRLARLNKGKEFVIMETVKSYKIDEFVETDFNDYDESIPF